MTEAEFTVIITGLRDTREIVEGLVRDNVRARTDLEHLSQRVGKLTHELLEGNGRPPLIVQVALIQESLRVAKVDADEAATITWNKYTTLESRVRSLEHTPVAVRAARYGFLSNILVGILSAIGSVFAAYLMMSPK